MIFWPKLSPDGSKLYYYEAEYGPNRSLLFYIKGQDVAPIIAGPYLKPSGYGTFLFSNDSKYVVCHVESFTRGMAGLYLILNSKLLGPYNNIKNDFHFTKDSKFLIYTHDGIEEKIAL
jgi:hypothetical protein